MSTLLCETVTATTMADLRAARDRVTAADMVELRLDGVADVDVDGALAGRRLPVIVTCRARWEGGRFDGAEEDRRALLARALAAGAEFVDVEWRAGFDALIAGAPERVIVSSHDFDGVPADLRERVRAMRGTGAGLIKVAVAPAGLAETLPLRDIGREGGAIVIGMGAAGFPTRVLADRYGSRWSYAGDGVAPGQVPAARMVHDYGFGRVGPQTRLFGVVSTTALYSLSPVMHNAAFAEAGLDAVYVPLATTTFADFLAFADAMGIEGVSVTVPFKLDALRAATTADAVTRRVGAANTLRRAAAGWEATNTDVDGFLAPLHAAWPEGLANVRASVVGAGGSARAVVVALRDRGAQVTVHGRRRDQVAALVADFGIAAGAWPPPPGSWDLLVNCTPLGGAALRDQSPVPAEALTGGFVYDLTYGPGTSRLLADAAAAGCRTLDGLPMLAAQAERQFEWWTGERPPQGLMHATLQTRICN